MVILLRRARSAMRQLICLLAAAAVVSATAAHAEDVSFDAWVEQVRAEAAQRGLSSPAVQSALADIKFIDRVIELDRRQPELTQTLLAIYGRPHH